MKKLFLFYVFFLCNVCDLYSFVIIEDTLINVGGNPLKFRNGLTDPHIFIHDNKAYMFASHDFSPKNTDYVMKDWWVWTSDDLLKWKHLSTIIPEQTFLKRPYNSCWATYGVNYMNKWYFYFSAGKYEIGVLVADSLGNWNDILGSPLIPKGLTSTEQRDPDILIDDDGSAYIIYGTYNYYIARLNSDMVSLAETPRCVSVINPVGPYGKGKMDDKPSLHKYKGRYYLSWSGFYAVSDNVYGPYEYRGCVFSEENMMSTFKKGNICWDRHGNFFKFHNQWYYTFNDQSAPECSNYYRGICISYVHYLDNGDIAPIYLDDIGVGRYDATKRIEAENYFSLLGGIKAQSKDGGFEIRGINEKTVLLYPNIYNLSSCKFVKFRASNGNKERAIIEIRRKTEAGELLAECEILPTGSSHIYQTFSCEITDLRSTDDICLIFRGNGCDLLNLNWVEFEN